MNIKEILEGWKNVLVVDEHIEELAKVRLELCNKCENKTELLNVECCGLCHCPLISKTRSKDTKCPMGKW